MSNEFVAKHGLISQGNLTVIGNISGASIIDADVITQNGIQVATIQDLSSITNNTSGVGGYEGIIHITNVSNSGNIQKTYLPNTGNNVIDSFTSDTTNNILELTGVSLNEEWYPTVEVNSIPMTGWVEQSNGKFKTSYNISLSGSGNIQAIHANGTSHTITYNISTVGPSVLTANLGAFPTLSGFIENGEQTSLKNNDQVIISGTCDINATYIEVVDTTGSIFKSGSGTVTGGTYSFTATVSNRDSLADGTQYIKLRTRNSLGTYGNTFVGSSAILDQTAPSIGTITISYPATQGALKNSETATVSSTVTGETEIVYSSPNSELSVTNPNTNDTAKTVTRINGSYNVSTNNYQIVARKASNGTTTTSSTVVFIANIAPTINITYPNSRLRSSPSGLNHLVTATSSQRLASFVLTSSTIGTFQSSWSGATNNTIWTRNLQIIDSDAKGTSTLSSMTATGLSGLTQTTINSGSTFTAGGFTSRTLTISAWPNREVAIGTHVLNTAKLTCEVLSKGGDGANGGTNFTYNATIANAVDQFTITEPSTVANATGNIWYNKDQSNAVSNTGGSAQIILEEIV